MTPLLVLAVALSLLIGVSLGLLGGGGSILTVPILIYALQVEEKSAIASSLLIVGVTSLVAVIQHARAGNVVWRMGLLFSAGSMAGAFGGGMLAKHIPSSVLLLLFAAIMIATAVAMWRGRADAPVLAQPKALNIPVILAEGLVVGLVTGLVGAGGGFLVVPALALLGGLPMQMAVGTSLLVIALKSFAGFAGYASHVTVDWSLTFVVMAAAIVGSLVGARLTALVSPAMLRRGFAGFVLLMGVFLLGKQVQTRLATPAVAASPVTKGPARTPPAGPAGDAIRRGLALAERTGEVAADHVGNDLRCASCHLDAGTKPGAASWVGVTRRFPQYRARSGKVDTIEDRVNDCFERSMNGTPLPAGDPRMADIVAYMTWLTETTPKLPTAQEAAIAKLKLTEAPDLQAGHTAYTQKCASCHGEDGQGRHAPDGKVLFPPLWGQRSFNLGAGLARQQTAAGFIKHNMPLGQGMTLTDAEAWNITGYMESQQRPDFASKDKDWPKGGKPEDARY
jgi:cytochrome c/uncharacterized membrane protein YfcA